MSLVSTLIVHHSTPDILNVALHRVLHAPQHVVPDVYAGVPQHMLDRKADMPPAKEEVLSRTGSFLVVQSSTNMSEWLKICTSKGSS